MPLDVLSPRSLPGQTPNPQLASAKQVEVDHMKTGSTSSARILPPSRWIHLWWLLCGAQTADLCPFGLPAGRGRPAKVEVWSHTGQWVCPCTLEHG